MTKLRYDFQAIAEWIGEGETVLDLGCGDGSLLRYLADTRGGYSAMGVEADPRERPRQHPQRHQRAADRP